MAQWHLKDLRGALERHGWRFAQELPGDDYRISATWTWVRSGRPPTELIIDFDGLDDMHTLPIHESYGCQARGTSHSLYFRRRREKWTEELQAFVAAVGRDHAV